VVASEKVEISENCRQASATGNIQRVIRRKFVQNRNCLLGYVDEFHVFENSDNGANATAVDKCRYVLRDSLHDVK